MTETKRPMLTPIVSKPMPKVSNRPAIWAFASLRSTRRGNGRIRTNERQLLVSPSRTVFGCGDRLTEDIRGDVHRPLSHEHLGIVDCAAPHAALPAGLDVQPTPDQR